MIHCNALWKKNRWLNLQLNLIRVLTPSPTTVEFSFDETVMCNWRRRERLFFSSLLCSAVIFQNTCANIVYIHATLLQCTREKKQRQSGVDRWWINAIMYPTILIDSTMGKGKIGALTPVVGAKCLQCCNLAATKALQLQLSKPLKKKRFRSSRGITGLAATAGLSRGVSTLCHQIWKHFMPWNKYASLALLLK